MLGRRAQRGIGESRLGAFRCADQSVSCATLASDTAFNVWSTAESHHESSNRNDVAEPNSETMH